MVLKEPTSMRIDTDIGLTQWFSYKNRNKLVKSEVRERKSGEWQWLGLAGDFIHHPPATAEGESSNFF